MLWFPVKTEVTDNVVRFGVPAMAADLVSAGHDTLRIGSVPDISKVLEENEIVNVFVPEWHANLFGDSFAGEEFVMWRTLFGSQRRHCYFGPPHRLEQLRRRLEYTVPYDFSDDHTEVIRQNWLDKVFTTVPGNRSWGINNLTITEEGMAITVRKGQEVLHEYSCDGQAVTLNDIFAARVHKLQAPEPLPRGLEIIVVGSGNGFVKETASFILRWGDQLLWIDPPPYPLQSLAGLGLDSQAISAIFISHNHEDHISGVIPLAEYAHQHGQQLKIMTCSSVYELLLKQFELYPLSDRLDWIQIEPGSDFLWEGATLRARWNHHCLPSGTMGLKVGVPGAIVGISGDTFYSPDMVARLGRDDLHSAWFKDCALVLHEVAPDSEFSVHTTPSGLQHLDNKLAAKLRAYHCAPKLESKLPCPRAKRGECYQIVDGEVSFKRLLQS